MYLIIDKDNQLANRLFVYAHTIAAAREHNTSVVNLGFAEYANKFPAIASDLWCRYPQHIKTSRHISLDSRERAWRLGTRLVHLMERGGQHHLGREFVVSGRSGYETTAGKRADQAAVLEYRLDTPEFRQLSNSFPIIILHGPLLRAHTYIQKHARAIREFFHPTQSATVFIDKLLREARSSCELVVGVHIRRGDYINFLDGRHFYSFEEYYRVMEGIENLHPEKRMGFLVCSNEQIPRDAFKDCRVSFGSGDIIEDLYSLASCDYIIGPPSTYSNWASFYGNVPIYSMRDPTHAPSTHDFKIVRG